MVGLDFSRTLFDAEEVCFFQGLLIVYEPDQKGVQYNQKLCWRGPIDWGYCETWEGLSASAGTVEMFFLEGGGRLG
jgi:hypothetical protein